MTLFIKDGDTPVAKFSLYTVDKFFRGMKGQMIQAATATVVSRIFVPGFSLNEYYISIMLPVADARVPFLKCSISQAGQQPAPEVFGGLQIIHIDLHVVQ